MTRLEGKCLLKRSTTYEDGILQETVFPENHLIEILCGRSKGIKMVLEERGLWLDGITLNLKGN